MTRLVGKVRSLVSEADEELKRDVSADLRAVELAAERFVAAIEEGE
jgi:hypothetical protein